MTTNRPAVLVIAGSDSGAGAGIQRDLRVLAHLGADAVTAITAVTAQSDHRLMSVLMLPPELVRDQIQAALETRPVAAVKIGMLGTRATVETIADCLGGLPGIPLVLDPVLVSSAGSILLDAPGQDAMRDLLFPLAALVTPNIPEAAALLGEALAEGEEQLLDQARRLRDLGSRAVLLKGGHRGGDHAVDFLLEGARDPVRLSAPRLSRTMRGTGCALATAIAASMSAGRTLVEACAGAKAYVLSEMESGLAPPRIAPMRSHPSVPRQEPLGESGTR